MSEVGLRFLGCGDAFNSGGRLHACFWVDAPGSNFLVDCGPSALAGMKANNIDPDLVDAVFISHLHADHFLGVPFLLLELDFVKRRAREIVIVGPPGIQERTQEAMELFFPGTTLKVLPVRYVELQSLVPAVAAGVAVTAYPVIHVPETNPHALRLEVAGRTIGYSGDTEWTDALIDVADGADVFICECSMLDADVKGHLNASTLIAKRDLLRCERVVLVHMGPDVLSGLPIPGFEAAEDGMRVTL